LTERERGRGIDRLVSKSQELYTAQLFCAIQGALGEGEVLRFSRGGRGGRGGSGGRLRERRGADENSGASNQLPRDDDDGVLQGQGRPPRPLSLSLSLLLPLSLSFSFSLSLSLSLSLLGTEHGQSRAIAPLPVLGERGEKDRAEDPLAWGCFRSSSSSNRSRSRRSRRSSSSSSSSSRSRSSSRSSVGVGVGVVTW
jgi:hypothetical protein